MQIVLQRGCHAENARRGDPPRTGPGRYSRDPGLRRAAAYVECGDTVAKRHSPLSLAVIQPRRGTVYNAISCRIVINQDMPNILRMLHSVLYEIPFSLSRRIISSADSKSTDANFFFERRMALQISCMGFPLQAYL